jgi:glycosyltransferase involved in cell wall biosynthesis
MVVTLHGYDINIDPEWWQAGCGGMYRVTYPQRLLQMAREPSIHFIAVSQAIKRRAIEYGIPEDKITVCYIGVDTERFKPGRVPIDQRRKRILFVGRMVEKKAPLLLIRAFSEVRKQVPDAELVMIGDGPLLKDAKQLARALDVSIEFMGAQHPDAVLSQLHLARVFCLPSITAKNGDAEGFGLVILESQASGVPVVTSAKGGAAEGVLDRESGCTFHEGDIHAMVSGLLHFLDADVTLVAASVAATRHIREHFDLSTCSAGLKRIYDRTSSATT